MHDSQEIIRVLGQAKKLAQEYRRLTGKPLGITGEVAEFEASRLLELTLTPARHAGHDAVRPADGRTFQIKGRCVLPGSKRSQKLGSIDVKKAFDAVLLVLLDHDFNATAIYEADRADVLDALSAPGSKARNERGALSVSRFKAIGHKVWPPAGANACNRTVRPSEPRR